MGNTMTEQLASLKKMSKKVKVTNMKVATTRHGRKYGYSFQKVPPKTFGERSLGIDSTPPIRGLHDQIQHSRRRKIDKIWYPRVAPVAHTTGIKAKPSARLVESVNSPMVLFMTPSEKRIISNMHAHGFPVTHQYCHSKDRKGIGFFQHRISVDGRMWKNRYVPDN